MKRLLLVSVAALAFAPSAWAPPYSHGIYVFENQTQVFGADYTAGTGEIEVAGKVKQTRVGSRMYVNFRWRDIQYVAVRVNNPPATP